MKKVKAECYDTDEIIIAYYSYECPKCEWVGTFKIYDIQFDELTEKTVKCKQCGNEFIAVCE